MNKLSPNLFRITRWVSIVAFGIFAAGLLGVATAHADSFDFGIPNAPSGGAASYAGGTTPLTVNNVSVDTLKDITTGGSVALAGTCSSACLNITSGNEVSFSAGILSFAGNSTPGSVTIFGTAPAAGITTPTDLLTGTVTGAQVVPSSPNQAVDVSTIINFINSGLLAHFGDTTDTNFNGGLNLSILLSSGSVSPSGFTAGTLSGDLTDTPTPEPGSLALVVLGMGLVGFAIKRRGTLGDNLAG